MWPLVRTFTEVFPKCPIFRGSSLIIIPFCHLYSTTVTNVALGTSLILRSLSAAFWVFIAYIIFDFCAYVALTIIFTVKSCVSDDPGNTSKLPVPANLFVFMMP